VSWIDCLSSGPRRIRAPRYNAAGICMRAIRVVRSAVEGIPVGGCTSGGVTPRFTVDPAPRRTVSLGFIVRVSPFAQTACLRPRRASGAELYRQNSSPTFLRRISPVSRSLTATAVIISDLWAAALVIGHWSRPAAAFWYIFASVVACSIVTPRTPSVRSSSSNRAWQIDSSSAATIAAETSTPIAQKRATSFGFICRISFQFVPGGISRP
jgi:uncharacterized membrane protein YphA (DoxX/SURF4 family)